MIIVLPSTGIPHPGEGEGDETPGCPALMLMSSIYFAVSTRKRQFSVTWLSDENSLVEAEHCK